MVKKEKIHIVAIIGSVAANNNTSKATALVVDELNKHEDVSVEVVDPNQMKLVLPGKEEDSCMVELQNLVRPATGVIIATPEYHGSYSSVIKLIIDNLGFPSMLSGKPVAMLGVASGAIGAIKALEHLRSVCSHVGAIVLPSSVSVAGVHKVFDERGRCLDANMDKCIRSLAENLLDYINKHICPLKTMEDFVRGNQS